MGSNRRRTVGPQDNELDSAGCVGEPARVKAKPVHKRELMYVVHVGQGWCAKRCAGASCGWRRNGKKVERSKRGCLIFEATEIRSQSPYSTVASQRARKAWKAKPGRGKKGRKAKA